MVKDGNLKSEIEKCFDLYEECKGIFEDKDVEKYAKLLRDLKSDYKRDSDRDRDYYIKVRRADLKILRDIRK